MYSGVGGLLQGLRVCWHCRFRVGPQVVGAAGARTRVTDSDAGSYVLDFSEVDQAQVGIVGGKGAHLGELSRIDGVRVPGEPRNFRTGDQQPGLLLQAACCRFRYSS